MNTPSNLPVKNRTHPLLLLAAAAVVLFSLVGTAAIMGWLQIGRASCRERVF